MGLGALPRSSSANAANTVSATSARASSWAGVKRSMKSRRTALTWLGAAALMSSRPAGVTTTTAPRLSLPQAALFDQASLRHTGHLVRDPALFPAELVAQLEQSHPAPWLVSQCHKHGVVLVAEA